MHEFPLKGSVGPYCTVYPETDSCAHCRASFDREGEYVAFDALTMLAEDKSFERGEVSELNSLSVGLWHVQNYKELKGTKVYVVRDVRGGHAMIFFCSTRCLRAFLNAAVDELESGRGLPVDN
jgi:hypothetical protein